MYWTRAPETSCCYEYCNIRYPWFKLFDLILFVIILSLFGYYFYFPFCAFIFECGCKFGKNTEKAEEHCNIHHVHGYKCPFCDASPYIHWIISPTFINILMCISYIWRAICQWKIKQRIKYTLERKLSVQNVNNKKTTITNLLDETRMKSMELSNNNIRYRNSYSNHYFGKWLRRIWIPLFIFILYNILLGTIFALAESYSNMFGIKIVNR